MQPAGGDPAVQAAQDRAVMQVIELLEREISAKVKDGDELKKMSLPDLFKELRELIKAAKKSAPGIVFAVPPSLPQVLPAQDSRLRTISAAADHPEDRQALLESQQRYLDRKENERG